VRLLGLYLKGVRLEAGLTIEEIGKRLNELAPADLQAICAAAKRMAFNRIANCDQLPPLSWSDFERATERVRGDMVQADNTGLQ
jgi:ATP-dependent 26S proteasome regulatory subunit